VDFQALANVASDHGLQDYDVITQGDFLGRLGIHERTKQLVTLRPDQEKTLVTACERLTSNEQMGSLFKVLGISSQDIALPALQKSS
jgi:NADH dehydrogenase [ubiquinone] 1 alpha subcomplex assembly factor 7